MAQYRKKPIEIEAFQLNSRGLVEEDWFWDAVTKNHIITHSFGKHDPIDAWCEIRTLEGLMIANTGDYIIRGIKGEIYPCKADIFEATYDAPTTDVAPKEDIIRDVISDIKKMIHNNATYPIYGGAIGNYITLKAVDALLQDYLNKHKERTDI